MTTKTNSGLGFTHTSDATYRAWVGDFLDCITNGNLAGGGSYFTTFQPTSDTTNVTSTTLAAATRPATNTINLSMILKFIDTQSGSAPIYVKLGFGTGATATTPAIQFTIGTGSDGSGNITGSAIAPAAVSATNNGTLTALLSTCCAVDGHFSIVFKRNGAANAACWGTIIDRTVDSSGVPDARGVSMLRFIGDGATLGYCYNFATSTLVVNGATSLGIIFGGLTASLVGGVAQVYPYYSVMPAVTPMLGACAVITSEINDNTTFTAKLIGTTSHTYLARQANSNSQTYTVNASTLYGIAQRWE